MVRSRLPIGWVLAAFILVLSTPPVEGATYRCATAEGEVLFTQFGCPEGASAVDGENSSDGGVMSIIKAAGLTDAERRTLKALSAELDRERRHRAKNRDRMARSREQARTARRQRCTQALAKLDDLAAARRKGYNAVEDRRWDGEESHWKAVRRADC